MDVTTEELEDRRRQYGPAVAVALDQLSVAAAELATELREYPGIGIGLQYAPLWKTWEQVEGRVRYYQNELQHLFPRSFVHGVDLGLPAASEKIES